MSNLISFSTSDGKIIKVPLTRAKQSITIAHMLEDSEFTDGHPLIIDFAEATMIQVFKFCEYYEQNPKIPMGVFSGTMTPEKRAMDDESMGVFYSTFARDLFANRPLFNNVLDASDFLDIPHLRSFLSRAIARELIDKSTHEMCAILGLPVPTKEDELERTHKLLNILHQEVEDARRAPKATK